MKYVSVDTEIWDDYVEGRIDFPTLQATYPGGVPDSVGRIQFGPQRPWTKKRTKFMERMVKDIVGRIERRSVNEIC